MDLLKLFMASFAGQTCCLCVLYPHHQRGKVGCFALLCDYQRSDFTLSSFSRSPCLCFHFLSPAACPDHVCLSLPPSLFTLTSLPTGCAEGHDQVFNVKKTTSFLGESLFNPMFSTLVLSQ